MLKFSFPSLKGVRATSLARLACIGLVAAAALPAQAQQRVYLRSEAGPPWSGMPNSNVNETAMDTVFGAGNWLDQRYESVKATTLFSGATRFIFMEGSDVGTEAMQVFLDRHQEAMESWVSSGGALFLNAAPTQGGNVNAGFGATLEMGIYSYSASAFDPLHPIFNVPGSEIGTKFTGDILAHANVSGEGFSAILGDRDSDVSVLSEKAVGDGWVVLGTMTTPNFHTPQPQATQLRNNILSYADGKAASASSSPVPEPGTIALLLAGAAPVALVARRRKAV